MHATPDRESPFWVAGFGLGTTDQEGSGVRTEMLAAFAK